MDAGVREYLRQLADRWALFDVDEVDPTRGYDLLVAYDDVVAGVFQDAVAGSADALRSVPGIIEVVHLDRERLTLRGDSNRGDVEAALKDYWTPVLDATGLI